MPPKSRTRKPRAPRAQRTSTRSRAPSGKIWGLKPTKNFITNQLVLFYDGTNTQYGKIVSQTGGTYTIRSIGTSSLEFSNIPPNQIAGKNSLPSFFAQITPAEQTIADGCQQTCPVNRQRGQGLPRINLDRQPILNMLEALVCTKPAAADGSCPLKQCDEGERSDYKITFVGDLIKPVDEENTHIAERPFPLESGNNCCIRINAHDETPVIELIQQCDISNYHEIAPDGDFQYITEADIANVSLYNKNNNIISIYKGGSTQQYHFYHCYKATRDMNDIYILLTYIPTSVLCRIKNTYTTPLVGRGAPELRDTGGILGRPERQQPLVVLVQGFDENDIQDFKTIFCNKETPPPPPPVQRPDIDPGLFGSSSSEDEDDDDEGDTISFDYENPIADGTKSVRSLSYDGQPYSFVYY